MMRRGAEDGMRPGGECAEAQQMGYRIWDMGTKPLGSGAVDERSEPRRGGTVRRAADAIKMGLGYWG
jgi:hypothetical protein